ncbi:MAG TPA: hypothetical protein VNW99_14260 [Cytophagaceae bacterium]|jgi:hypothetical protein|nr:hypothetical protein [Cytophagaceae bacterium]
MKDEKGNDPFGWHVKLWLGLISMVMFIASCNRPCSPEDTKRKPVARVQDTYLYEDQLVGIVSQGISKADSIKITDNYITNWTKEMLILRKAEANLSEEQKNVDKQLQAYRKSLLLYAYEKELVRQKLDTVVSQTEIEDYYQKNQGNFQLKDNIIKVLYVKVKKKAPQLAKLRVLYRSDLPHDREALESYCHEFAENFYLDDNSWLLFDDLLKEIPIEAYNKELFLRNNRFVEVTDSLHYYFVNIKGFKIKNSISPLAFEKENIRNAIINKRKLQLINAMKEDVYRSAEEHKEVEYFK